MKKEYKVKKKRGWFFVFLKSIVRVFKRRPKIIDLNNGKIESRAIYIANHSGASGPFTFELFFPKYFIPWGTHEMCGNYKERWNYLYHVFYRQKLHYNKFRAFWLATLFGIISKSLYNATGLIGTYRDVRLFKTFKDSFKVLDENIGLLIFPENSSDGYHELIKEYFRGFVSLAKVYFRKRKLDLPVYNIYYSKKHNKMIIDKPIYINKLLDEKMNEQEIADLFLRNSQKLFAQVSK